MEVHIKVRPIKTFRFEVGSVSERFLLIFFPANEQCRVIFSMCDITFNFPIKITDLMCFLVRSFMQRCPVEVQVLNR